MSKTPKITAVSSAGDRDPSPPRGLQRADQREFRRLCSIRRAAGRPVSELESDVVVDLIQARERLLTLQHVLWEEEAKAHFFLKDRIALAAAIDRAAGVVHRLSRALGLIG